MPDDDYQREQTLKAKVVPRICEIEATQWDACANPLAASFNPFVAHGFLAALEEAGCAGGRTGWRPRHIVLEDDFGTVNASKEREKMTSKRRRRKSQPSQPRKKRRPRRAQSGGSRHHPAALPPRRRHLRPPRSPRLRVKLSPIASRQSRRR